ncbi:MAG: DUF5662 family protein [Faecalimonas sp.]|nr:DUF5662 family protein [Faecalimonas sp.]
MSKAWQHFCTITQHKIYVAKGCFKVGLYWQGLMHDMSKYSPVEFRVGAKYYQGTRSPNSAEREEKGCSPAWLHHKGRNKHHFEYWIDYASNVDEVLAGMKMPNRYIVEMFMDRIAACKVYLKDKYVDRSPLDYYNRSKHRLVLHDYTRNMLETLLEMLAEKGEEETFRYIRKEIKL